jgi:hypothetical protein
MGNAHVSTNTTNNVSNTPNYKEATKLLSNTAGMSETGLTAHLVALLIKTVEETTGQGPNIAKDIRDFHEKFNQSHTGPVRTLDGPLADFRIKFLKEELKEFIDAVKSGSKVDQIDGLIDLIYVAVGSLNLMGVDFNRAWTIVHDSNMSKTSVAMGEGKYGWTIQKGSTYHKPNFNQLV